MTKRRAPKEGEDPERESAREAPPRDATPIDHAYKQLFSHAEMVRQLLVGFVHEDWVAELDFATLEPVRSSFVTDDMRQREDDVIWKVRWGERSLYVYLLLEFQSSVDDFMALRVANYVTLLYQNLLRQAKPRAAAKLPPVLPLVLYSGAQGWTAALELGELIEPLPLGMARSWLFRMEHAATEDDWLRLYQRLKALLDSADASTLTASSQRWLYRSYIRHKPAHLTLPDADDLMGVYAVLEKRMRQWDKEHMEKGREQGLREGIEQGLRQGLERGRHRGRVEGRSEAVRAMLRDAQLDAATIARYSGLLLEEVLELQERLATHGDDATSAASGRMALDPQSEWPVLFTEFIDRLDRPEAFKLRAYFRKWLRQCDVHHRHAYFDWSDPPDSGAERDPLDAFLERVQRWNRDLTDMGRRLGTRRGLAQGREQGLREGHEQGSLEVRRRTALAMLRDGKLDTATIARYAGLSVEVVLELQASLPTH